MSLYALADHMASKGRNGDSVLVHMTPGEVKGLQALALAHGGSLTINPETGLPEASFLKKILPAVAGFALNAFVPGLGSAIGGALGMSAAAGTGIAVGGLTALATGSLSRGLMAGLGAYGGAGLSSALTGAGAGAAQEAALSGLTQEQIAQRVAEENLANMATATTEQGVRNQIAADAAKRFGSQAVSDQLGGGLAAAAANPMGFAKSAFKPLMAAATPYLASEMVPTTTQRGDGEADTGNIRRFSFDPYGQTYTPLGVYPAKGYTGMASGGVVALANGGVSLPTGWGEAGGAYDTPEEKIAYFNQQNITPAQLAAQGVSQSDIDWMKSQGYAGDAIAPGSNRYVENVKNWFEERPTATYQDVQDAIQQWGLNPTDVNAAMQQAGLSGAAQFAAFNPNIGSAANVEETYSGLKGLSSNINYWLQQNPGASLNDIRREMGLWELSDADIVRATGKTPEQLATGPLTQVYNPAPGAGGNLSAVVNPNGTITQTALPPSVTTHPLTGRPADTSTIAGIRDLYTAGGGSLGQTNLFVPKTVEEMYARYANTGGSKQAYDYLMGKGAADIRKPVTPTGELMLPYNEAVMGMPSNLATKKFIFDRATQQYLPNPDYKPLSYDSKGIRRVGMSANEIKAAATTPAGLQGMVDANTVTYEEIARALGITVEEAMRRYPRTVAATPTTPVADAGGAGSSGDNFGGAGGYDGGISSADAAAASGANAGAVGGGGFGAAAGEAGAEGGFGGPGGVGGWAHGGQVKRMALGGLGALAAGGAASHLGDYSDGGRLLKGPGDGVSDSIPATIGDRQPARLADGEFVIPARIVSEIGNGSTDAGARKLYAMMDRVQRARGKTTGKGKVAKNTRAENYLPA